MAKGIAGHSWVWWIVVGLVVWFGVHWYLKQRGTLAANSQPHSPKMAGQGGSTPASQLSG